jgi:hypothetical protein
MEKLWNYEKIVPSKEGNFTYFFKNNGLQKSVGRIEKMPKEKKKSS